MILNYLRMTECIDFGPKTLGTPIPDPHAPGQKKPCEQMLSMSPSSLSAPGLSARCSARAPNGQVRARSGKRRHLGRLGFRAEKPNRKKCEAPRFSILSTAVPGT